MTKLSCGQFFSRLGGYLAFGLACGALLSPAAANALLTADVNCDQRVSAADFVAAVIVSYDGTQYAGCAAADPYRSQLLTDQAFLPLFSDIFDTFAARNTPTPTVTASQTDTFTRTPTHTPTRVPSLSPSPTSTASATPSPSASQTSTPTNTNTPTLTFTPRATATLTPTRTPSPTRTASPTATPTGLAYQLSGSWLAYWGGQICYLNGQSAGGLIDTTYLVTALDGQLDIQIVGGASLGRGLSIGPGGTVQFRYTADSGVVCTVDGIETVYQFDYTFTFSTNGTGSAKAAWSYGENAHCAVCEVTDAATLVRVAGPGS